MTAMGIRELTLEVLTSPKRRSESQALGFAGGEPVGTAMARGASPAGYWWRPHGPEPIATPDARKRSAVFTARGDWVGGAYEARPGARALLWRREGDALGCTDLHVDGFQRTEVQGVRDGLAVGSGVTRAGDARALLWVDARSIVLEPGNPRGDSRAFGVGGGLVVGGHGGAGSMQACAWDVHSHERIDLPANGFQSASAYDACEGYQVGEGFDEEGVLCPSLWKGTSECRVLTPEGYHAGSARSCDGALQVGYVRRDAGAWVEAALWEGSKESFVNLGEVVSPPFNASHASSIEVQGADVRIAGAVQQLEEQGGADVVLQERAAVWRATLVR